MAHRPLSCFGLVLAHTPEMKVKTVLAHKLSPSVATVGPSRPSTPLILLRLV